MDMILTIQIWCELSGNEYVNIREASEMYWYREEEKKKKNIVFLMLKSDDYVAENAEKVVESDERTAESAGKAVESSGIEAGTETIDILSRISRYALSELCRGCYADFVLLCCSQSVKQLLDSEECSKWMDSSDLKKYFSCVIDVAEQKNDKIRQYLESHEHEEYVIIDYEEMEPYFPGHTLYLEKAESFTDSIAKKSRRILEYGAYASKLHSYNPGNSMGDFVEDYISKAIFLDIDGVLNDDGERRDKGEIICPEYVANLAWIIEQTGAEIILSSSWRYGMIRNDLLEDSNIRMLLNEFAKYHLRIVGMTPLCFNGPDGRPYEVRSWLTYRPKLKSFVILDDEGFWRWNWLSDRVVCTARESAEKKRRWRTYEKGLDREFAQRAVDILNR